MDISELKCLPQSLLKAIHAELLDNPSLSTEGKALAIQDVLIETIRKHLGLSSYNGFDSVSEAEQEKIFYEGLLFSIIISLDKKKLVETIEKEFLDLSFYSEKCNK